MPSNTKPHSSAVHAPRSHPYSFYFLWFAIPALTTLNQACIKLLANHMQEKSFNIAWVKEALTQPYFMVIMLCEITSFALWITILSDTSVSKATPITALAYIAILLTSWTVFHEPLHALQLIGSALILFGVWLIGTATSDTAKGEII